MNSTALHTNADCQGVCTGVVHAGRAGALAQASTQQVHGSQRARIDTHEVYSTKSGRV